jgi:hypothetical protein
MQPFDAGLGDVVVNQNFMANNSPGMSLSVRTDQGTRILAWEAMAAVQQLDSRYFCHGLTFNTFREFGPGYKYSVFGNSVARVLADEYQLLGMLANPGAAINVQAWDIAVWWLGMEAYHSAIIQYPAYHAGGIIDPATTMVRSKTGTGQLFTGPLSTVSQLHYRAGGHTQVYRRN